MSEENLMQGWRLDKHVPLALIAAIVLQSGIFGAWVGALNHRVTSLETAQEEYLADRQRERRLNEDVRDRLVRVETLMEAAIDRLDRIDERTSRAEAEARRRRQPE